MPHLLFVSLVWAFSFGLFKGHLTGLDPFLIAFLRLSLALLPFACWALRRPLPPLADLLRLLGIGAVQFGCMYAAYNLSFRYLLGYQVALFTVFTPVYVSLWHDLRQQHWHPRNLLAAVLAMIGGCILLYHPLAWQEAVLGFLLVQVSNLFFAIGQIEYRRFRKLHPDGIDHELFFWALLGGALVSALAVTFSNGWTALLTVTLRQWLVLVYLGLVASGLCFYFWNYGARQVQPGTLAVLNNLKIPLALLASVGLFGEKIHLTQFCQGAALYVLALGLTRRDSPTGLK